MQKHGGYHSRKMNRIARKGFRRVVAGVALFCTICSCLLPVFAATQTDTFCRLEHEHIQSCYVKMMSAEPQLDLTGMVLHTHNKFCYDRDGKLICPLPKVEEHEHGDDCYGIPADETEPAKQPHVHSDECYTKERGDLICTTAEQVAHIHTDACYELVEQGTEEVHVHTDGCYTKEQGELTCTIPEQEGHTHSDACFVRSEELICAAEEGEEHTHTDACYGKTVVCELQEDAGHSHGGACYEWKETLSCDLEEVIPAATAPEKVLICTETEQAAHVHGDECYEWTEVLNCGKDELPSESTESTEPEKVLICTKTELKNHIHADECYEVDLFGTAHLICDQYQMEEHQHTEACLGFSEDALLCELAEGEAHQHSYSCYHSWVFLCQMEGEPDAEPETEPVTEPETEPATEPETEPATEPVIEEISDQTADVERRKDWEQTFAHVELTGAWAYDLIAIANTQLGYKESERNFIAQENGDHKGYTRYGDWYGSNYANWCAMFVSFCLTYANVEGVPQHPGCDRWISELKEANMYATADVYTPKPGDVVFFDCSRKSKTAAVDSDHVGIVTEVIPATKAEPAKIRTIEGNKENCVAEGVYDLDDLRILGYGILPDGPAAVYSCGMEAHTHDMDYYSKESNVICELEEHVHNDICRSKELRYADDSLWAVVTLNNAVYLPENLDVRIELVTKDQEPFDGATMTAVADAMTKSDDICFCRMELLVDGQPYKLPLGVQTDVQIAFAQPVFAAESVSDEARVHTFVLIEEEADADSTVLKAVELPADYYEDADGGMAGLYVCTNQVATIAIALGSTT